MQTLFFNIQGPKFLHEQTLGRSGEEKCLLRATNLGADLNSKWAAICLDYPKESIDIILTDIRMAK